MNKDEVERRVRRAIDRLMERDEHLLTHDVNERSISHRLAMYLQEEFSKCDVDCEYNRNEYEQKRLDLLRHRVRPDEIPEEVPIEDTEARTVYPDIIVHRRGSNTENILVIEIKKTTSTRNNELDLAKLQAFREAPYNYSFGLYLCFQTGRREVGVAEIQWFPE